MINTENCSEVILKSIERKNLFTQKVFTRFCYVAILLVISVIIIFGLLSVFMPKPTVSVYENRALTTMPKFTVDGLITGKYLSKLEAFYADTFPYRDKFVTLSANLNELRGVRIDDIKLHEINKNSNNTSTAASASSSEPAPKPNDTNNAVVPSVGTSIGQSAVGISSSSSQQSTDAGESYGNIFVYKGRAMSVFGGTKTASSRYANVINSYKDILGDSVNVYNVVIPTSIEFYLPEKYKAVSHSQKANIDNIYACLSPKVIGVDAYSEIQKHTEEYIYFNTDHHWTARGAYYAYTAFAKSAGFEPLQLTDFNTGRIDNFLGTMYGQTQDQKLKDSLDYIDYYIPKTQYTAQKYLVNQPNKPIKTSLHATFAKGSSAYSVFLYGDLPLISVQTENKNGKKIMVVKESFGNAFVPFLTSHYEEIYVVDLRYFQLGMIDFIKNNGINGLLFINNAFAANTNSFINRIDNMKYQEFTPVNANSSSSSAAVSSESTAVSAQQ